MYSNVDRISSVPWSEVSHGFQPAGDVVVLMMRRASTMRQDDGVSNILLNFSLTEI